MAWDAYLTGDGLQGESQRAGHEDEIELVGFDFGGSNPTSVGVGKGGGVGTVNLADFNIIKKTDASSATLFQHMCTGQHFPTCKVTMYKSGGDAGPVEFLLFEFEEAYVTNITWSGSEGGEEIPTESVSFAFGKVTITYNQQAPDGTVAGSFVGAWDIRTGEAG